MHLHDTLRPALVDQHGTADFPLDAPDVAGLLRQSAFFSVRVGRQTTSRSLSSVNIMELQALLLRDKSARECHIAQTRKPLKNARETSLFGARVPARRGVARVVSRTYTLARAPYRFAFIATFPSTRNSTPHASPLISDRHSLARRRCFFSVG